MLFAREAAAAHKQTISRTRALGQRIIVEKFLLEKFLPLISAAPEDRVPMDCRQKPGKISRIPLTTISRMAGRGELTWAIRDLLGADATYPVGDLDKSEILYGDLSNAIHNGPVREIVLSRGGDSIELREFLTLVATLFGKPTLEVEEDGHEER